MLLWPLLGHAQHQNDNWYFGRRVGLQVEAARYWPQQLTQSAMETFEACTSLSDSLTGNLLFYANGERLWDRTHQPIPGSTLVGTGNSASEGVLALPAPGRPGQAYMFTVDTKEHALRGGLRYSQLDMHQRGGLGTVLQLSVPIPLPGGVLPTECLAALRHPNGRDYWVLVHGFDTALFYAFLVSPAGIAPQPVVSAAGPVFDALVEAQTGTMRFSPSGRLLAVTRLFGALDVFNFDPLTGQVTFGANLFSHFTTPIDYFRVVGCEFSADGSVLYGDENGTVTCYDLRSGLAGPIRRSKRQLGHPASYPDRLLGAFRRAPNGRIYLAILNSTALAVVDSCTTYSAAYLRFPGQALSGPPPLPPAMVADSQFGLPNQAATLAPARSLVTIPAVAEELFTVDVNPGCAGQPSRLAVRTLPGTTAGAIQQVRWSVGSGPASQLLFGSVIAPVVGTAGPQSVVVTVSFTGGTRQTQQTILVVPPGAAVSLQAPVRQLACGELTVELRATASAAGRFSWDDDTTHLAWRTISRPGTYRVHFQSTAGCVATDSVSITQRAGSDCVIPNIITPNGDAVNQRFMLQGYEPAKWHLTLYNRWGRQVYDNPRYTNEWEAADQPAGIYFYLLQHNSSNKRLRGWIEVLRY